MKINAYVLEQPGENGFSGTILQAMTAILGSNVDYQAFYVEGDNSAVLAFVDMEVFNSMSSNDELFFFDRFQKALKDYVNGAHEVAASHICEILGLNTFWMQSIEDAKKIPPQWTLTDDDCAQWRRTLKLGESYELVQVVKFPEDFAVAHGIIYLSDYDEDEREDIIGAYGYTSWEDLVLKAGSAEAANELFAECAFETEFAEFISDVKLKTFEDAKAKVEEIII